MPVADKSFANRARDFLLFAPVADNSNDDSDENEYYVLSGFTNISYFRERIKTASPRGNQSIVMAFGMTENREGFEFLKNAIDDESCEYRHDAIRAMAPFVFKNHAEARQYLTGLCQDATDPQTRATALAILGLARDNAMAPVFVRLAESEDNRMRANAIEALIPLDLPEKRQILKKYLNDSAPRVCANALIGLWLLDDQDTLSCLYGLLKSDDSAMRASAAFATYFLANSRRFRRLFPAYSEQSNYTALPIVENVYKRLRMMLESIDASERYQALRAIGRIGDRESRDIIVRMLKEENVSDILELGNSIILEWDKMLRPEE